MGIRWYPSMVFILVLALNIIFIHQTKSNCIKSRSNLQDVVVSSHLNKISWCLGISDYAKASSQLSLTDCLANSNQSECYSAIQSWISKSSSDMSIESVLGNDLINAGKDKTVPNTCHCLSNYDHSIQCDDLLDDIFAYCRIFYPVTNFAPNAAFQCSNSILSMCNNTAETFESMILCAEVNAFRSKYLYYINSLISNGLE